MKFHSLTDVFHELIKGPALGEYIDPYPPSTPEPAIRIDFELDEHGYP
jgi:hypothetical protein